MVGRSEISDLPFVAREINGARRLHHTLRILRKKQRTAKKQIRSTQKEFRPTMQFQNA